MKEEFKNKDSEQTETQIDQPDLPMDQETDEEQPSYDFRGFFPEQEEEEPSFRRSWRNLWQVILGAYAAFLPLFLILFVGLFLTFLLLALFLRGCGR